MVCGENISESKNKAIRNAPCRSTRLEDSPSGKALKQYGPSFLPGRDTVVILGNRGPNLHPCLPREAIHTVAFMDQKTKHNWVNNNMVEHTPPISHPQPRI